MLAEEQTNHMERIAHRVNKDFIAKYTAGAIEHKGLLSDVPKDKLLDMLLEEVLDLISYVYSLKDALERENGTVSGE